MRAQIGRPGAYSFEPVDDATREAARQEIEAAAVRAFETYEQRHIRVSVVTRGLSHPWSVAFLPGAGDMLITERVGRLRQLPA